MSSKQRRRRCPQRYIVPTRVSTYEFGLRCKIKPLESGANFGKGYTKGVRIENIRKLKTIALYVGIQIGMHVLTRT